jgi:membrane protease YdiL (CAAX protease family)
MFPSQLDIRHPYRFVVVLEVLLVLVYLVAGAVTVTAGLPDRALVWMADLVLGAGLVVTLTLRGWWRTVGFRGPERARQLWYFAPVAVVALVNVVPGFDPGGVASLAGYVVLALLIGFVEETFFRGLMLRALLQRGRWRAVWVTSLIFALTHLMNSLTGRGVLDQATQVLFALSVGVCYAALAVHTGLLWPLVLTHALIDTLSMAQPDDTAVAGSALLAMALVGSALHFAYAWWLLTYPNTDAKGQRNADFVGQVHTVS